MEPVSVQWLEAAPSASTGTTFGLPWPRGRCAPSAAFTCADDAGRPVPLQTWPTAFWPDGSLKWTAHALPATEAPSTAYRVWTRSSETANADADAEPGFVPVRTVSSEDQIRVDTGKIAVTFSRHGRDDLVQRIEAANGCVVGSRGQLVLLLQRQTADTDADEYGAAAPVQAFAGRADDVRVEQDGPVRAVVAVRGTHHAAAAGGDIANIHTGTALPFVLRFYLYAGSEAVRVVHTLVYDLPADDGAAAVRGIGVRFRVPLGDTALHNRHVRLAGAGPGVFAEAVQGVTGLWRGDPGAAARAAQRRGTPTPAADHAWEDGDAGLAAALQRRWVPAWSDYSLRQLSPDGFTLQKRTRAGCGWVGAPGGTRAGGLAFLGSAHRGGLAAGLRHFWERFPTSIDVRDATQDEGVLTLWLYSPAAAAAGPMDLRPYHDGLGPQATHEDQLAALQITYEDWEPGLGSPRGIARTSELLLVGLAATPSARAVSALVAEQLRRPPLLVAAPAHLHSTGVFGPYWMPLGEAAAAASKATSEEAGAVADRLRMLFAFYAGQVEQRRWYGFWDHGDVMHTYDADRHAWRYDVGGFAWANSELSPDLWLWLYFLSTGRADVFRAAEALTRHTSEVDAYHRGPWRGLGTRHGVQHWSDSCKQPRVACALYRRVFFFLTGGDERTGDLLEEAGAAEAALLNLDPYRKVSGRGGVPPVARPVHPAVVRISLGTDWSALAAALLVAWERGGPADPAAAAAARAKLWRSMDGIGRLRHGFAAGFALYDTRTGDVAPVGGDGDGDDDDSIHVSHLSAMFGLVEVCAELLELLGDVEHDDAGNTPTFRRFRDAWLGYCQAYNAPAAEQARRYGRSFGRLQLRQGHARLTAYAARSLGSPALAARAWEELRSGGDGDGDGYGPATPWTVRAVAPHDSVEPAEEAPWVSTNSTALYGLAALQTLALVGETKVDSTL